MTNLYEAHRQWASRPPDERFPDLESLQDFVDERKQSSSETMRQISSCRLYGTHGGGLVLDGNGDEAHLTHWAFGQFCARVKAPASYLRSLPAEMAGQCLEYGAKKSAEDCNLLLRNARNSDGGARRIVSAFTSQSYGRIWDTDVLDAVMEAIRDSNWHPPPAYESNGSLDAGLYASDRDMFVFLIKDEDPLEIGDARLARGFFCWNSECGSATFGLKTFLFDFVCGNHIVWNVEEIRELRIIHRHRALDRFFNEAMPTLNNFVENRPLCKRIEESIIRAQKTLVGESLCTTLEWFKGRPFTKSELTAGWNAGLESNRSPETLWGMVQGLTAYAKRLRHLDARVSLENRAGKLLVEAN